MSACRPGRWDRFTSRPKRSAPFIQSCKRGWMTWPAKWRKSMRWTPDGAVAIVTGASSGIGRSLCLLLVQRGATVIAVARRRERLAELADCPAAGTVIPVAGDVTDPDVRDQAVDVATRVRDGAIDLLVNNAGSGA